MTVPPSPLPAVPAGDAGAVPRGSQPCAACRAPLADDQRYCLQCGEVRDGARRDLPAVPLGSIHARELSTTTTAAGGGAGERMPSLAVTLAGLACLLLAMGVGVLIGRGGGEAPAASAPITIAAPAAGTGAAGAASAAPAAFTSDWPSDTEGWTIALAVLPKASTTPAAVAAAKSEATDKGAKSVGALDADDYPSLTAGSYVVYAGVFRTRKAADAALPAARKSVTGAPRVVRVASSASSSGSAAKGASTSKTSGSKTAPSNTKKAFEESKQAPKTVGTGGKPPPKDDKPAANGAGFEEIG